MAGRSLPSLCLLVLLTALCWPAAVHASFIESFTKIASPSSSTAKGNYLPHLWQQVAEIDEGGRGPENQGFSMLFTDDTPIAETVLLQWEKTSPAELVFYASRIDTEWFPACAGSFKLLYSTDSISWSELWSEDLLEWTTTGYEPARVTLPLATEGDTKFALKWTYTQEKGKGFSCYKVKLDDLTFPAQQPAKAKAAVKPNAKPPKPVKQPPMPAGVAPIPMPLSFQGTCTWAATYCGMAVGYPVNATNTTAKFNGTAAAGNTTARANVTTSTATSTNTSATAASVIKTAPLAAPHAPKRIATDPPAAAANTASDTEVGTGPTTDHGGAEGTAAVLKGPEDTLDEDRPASHTYSTIEEETAGSDTAEPAAGSDTAEPAAESPPESDEPVADSEDEAAPNVGGNAGPNAVAPNAAAQNAPGRKLKFVV